MKKLTILVALILCVTIGGVYATWTYSGNTDIADQETEALIGIAGVAFDGAAGEFEISTNLKLSIDDDDCDGIDEESDRDKNAVLVFGSTDGEAPYLTVTFTPKANAGDVISTKGVPAEIYTKFNAQQYKTDAQGNYSATGTGKDIMNVFNPSDTVFDANILPVGETTGANQWTWNATAGHFEVTFDLDDLQAMFSLTESFRLDVKEEYDAFHNCLVGSIITIYVTDGTVNSTGDAG